MNYTITEVFLDTADKYRVRVVVSENTTQFFKFDHYPSQEEINNIVSEYKNSQNNIGVIE